MKNGIKLLADNTYGRVEISNRNEFKHFNLRPSKKAVEEIERLEELTPAAEQRLGNFVAGSNRGRPERHRRMQAQLHVGPLLSDDEWTELVELPGPAAPVRAQQRLGHNRR